MTDKEARLDAFRSEVDFHLGIGALADMELPVSRADGSCPVVVALDDEPLAILLSRLRAVGGAATVFVRGTKGVRMASVVDESRITAEPDDDMSSDNERPGPFATVGMFLDWVEKCPNGVAISYAAVGHPARARDAHRVELTV